MDRQQQPLTLEELMERPTTRHNEPPLRFLMEIVESACSCALGLASEAEYSEYKRTLDAAPPSLRRILGQAVLRD